MWCSLGYDSLLSILSKKYWFLEVAQRPWSFTITRIGKFHSFLSELRPSHWISLQLLFPFLLQFSTCSKCFVEHVVMVNIKALSLNWHVCHIKSVSQSSWVILKSAMSCHNAWESRSTKPCGYHENYHRTTLQDSIGLFWTYLTNILLYGKNVKIW